MSLKSLGAFVRDCRKNKKISQRQLADMINMDESYIRRLEAGKQVGSASSLVAVARALEIRPGLLLDLFADTTNAEELSPTNSIKLPEVLIGKEKAIERIENYIAYEASQQPEQALEDQRYLEVMGGLLAMMTPTQREAARVEQVIKTMGQFQISSEEAKEFVNKLFAKAEEVQANLVAQGKQAASPEDLLRGDIEELLDQAPKTNQTDNSEGDSSGMLQAGD